MKKIDKTLIVAGTHGDEAVGVKALEKLFKKSNLINKFDSLIANPKATDKGVRFIDADLNRVFPGKKHSSKYEVRRAYYLSKIFKRYKYIIDLHQTLINDRIVIIIANLTVNSLRLALALPIKEILIWPSLSLGKSAATLTELVNYGVEIECGVKNLFTKNLQKLVKILVGFIIEKNKLVSPSNIKRESLKRKFYLVYEKIKPQEVKGKKLIDFGIIKNKQETFIALLFGRHTKILGYKMRRVDTKWILTNLKK